MCSVCGYMGFFVVLWQKKVKISHQSVEIDIFLASLTCAELNIVGGCGGGPDGL